jgi:hypothetical protein
MNEENDHHSLEQNPPGGANTREVGLSVSTFPQFWFDPLAYTFADTLCTGGAYAVIELSFARLVESLPPSPIS